MTREAAGCMAVSASGSPCRAAPLKEERWCLMHHPDHAEGVAEARRLGGMRRKKEAMTNVIFDLDAPPGTVEGSRRLLELAVQDALGMDDREKRSKLLVQVGRASNDLVRLQQEGRLEVLESVLGVRR